MSLLEGFHSVAGSCVQNEKREQFNVLVLLSQLCTPGHSLQKSGCECLNLRVFGFGKLQKL